MTSPETQEKLRKGMLAARRGHEEPARRLLGEVVQAQPDNEEAWLWLARVAETPQQQAECLERVLKLNPNNHWAAEQLDQLKGQKPSPPPLPSSGPTQAPVERPKKEEPPALKQLKSQAQKPHKPKPLKPLKPLSADYELEIVKCPNCGSPWI